MLVKTILVLLCWTYSFAVRLRLRNGTRTEIVSDAAKHVVEHRSSVNATTAGIEVNGTSGYRPPRVYFLFMAVDKVSNLQVWWRFFEYAPADQYRAYVHCKLDSCKQMVAGSHLQVIPSVPSYYCTDLVSPMQQLLAQAIQNDGASTNPLDKFVFVSDSTLPAKPFSYIYSTLSSRAGSDFCVFPSKEWADIQSAGGLEVAVKFHQWITLSRAHAERSLQEWWAKKMHGFMWQFGMNTQAYTYNNNTFADSRNFGCLDEFWHMAVLYGTIGQVNANQERVVQLADFVSGPLWVSPSAGWQGQCDTFVVWAKYLHLPGKNPFNEMHTQLDFASVPHSGNSQRPGWWDTISSTGIGVIRNSNFLFARKFIDMPHLADGGDFAEAYPRIVFQG